ncbi:MAG TPA: teichoic acid D-Ala incorporation-associated protein DltX [Gemmataceae bacterium]|nr:teichoic acid D-Ala incorporation-associated protein DltX [Gemmataceae bacterium]
MTLWHLGPRLAGLAANPWLRALALTAYYVAILAGLLFLYGQKHFETPPFVYQGF